MDLLFRSFSQIDGSTTRRYGGTGLGLAISKRLVELMGGRIWAESEVGKGTTFLFTAMMATNDAQQAADDGDHSSATTLSGRHVLVVDDNEVNQKVLQAQLSSWGMTSTVVGAPRDSLELLGGDSRFDAAILDFSMPEVDGIGLARMIRGEPGGKSLPLVLFTSVVPLSQAQRDGVQALGFAEVLSKPIKTSHLQSALLRIVSGERRIVPATAAEPDPVESGNFASVYPLRILLVDDNQTNRKLGKKVLERLGYIIDLANDGAESVEAVRKHVYDLVLMDIEMPVMDGIEACDVIKQLGLDVRPMIVALTANAIAGDREKYLARGFDGYLSKPLIVDQLKHQLVLACTLARGEAQQAQ